MNRKQWITGTVLLILLAILCISGVMLAWNKWKGERGSIGQREVLPGIGYCSPRKIMPCILSFDLDSNGGMVVNVLVDVSTEDFYIKIRHKTGELLYECTRATEYSSHVTCTGKAAPVGEMLTFLLVSKEKDTTLAKGGFPIIGMALATPEINMTPTPFTHQGPR